MNLRSESWELFRTQVPWQSLRLIFEYGGFGQTQLETGDLQMLSAVELLGDVLLSALTLLIGSCIVGSIVAALRAVSRGSATANMRR
jgi:hypothetical protein